MAYAVLRPLLSLLTHGPPISNIYLSGRNPWHVSHMAVPPNIRIAPVDPFASAPIAPFSHLLPSPHHPPRYLNQYDTSLVQHVAPGWDRWFVMTSYFGSPDYYVSGEQAVVCGCCHFKLVQARVRLASLCFAWLDVHLTLTLT